MLKKVKQDLFWFLKKDAVLDLEENSARQIYVQQVMTHGRDADVREMIRDLGLDRLRVVFEDIKYFVPKQICMFWEDFFASGHRLTAKSS